MLLPNKFANDLVGKDKNKSLQAAREILSKPDMEAWACLVEKSEYLFGYIKDKAANTMLRAVDEKNFENLFQLMSLYSEDWDCFIAEAFCKFSNESLNERILNLLDNGSISEKTYAAKYFACYSYEKAKNSLFEASKSSEQSLKSNAAQALGTINDVDSFNYYTEKLSSSDEWEQLESAQFLSNYGNPEAVVSMFKAIPDSSVSEHISGEIAYLTDLHSFYEYPDLEIRYLSLEAFDNILSGIPEIWSLCTLFNFKIFENLEKLIEIAYQNPEDEFSGKHAQLLLKARSKFSLFKENSQYTFDEERNVLGELDEIYNLLSCQDDDFWQMLLQNLKKELTLNSKSRKIAALQVIRDNNFENALPEMEYIMNNTDEADIVIYETIITLKSLNKMQHVGSLNDITARFKDSNLAAIVEQALIAN